VYTPLLLKISYVIIIIFMSNLSLC